jgi:hypothetical protein
VPSFFQFERSRRDIRSTGSSPSLCSVQRSQFSPPLYRCLSAVRSVLGISLHKKTAYFCGRQLAASPFPVALFFLQANGPLKTATLTHIDRANVLYMQRKK